MGKARVILLNGVGSAGKSSIARALQVLAREPFLHVEMDTFIDMLPQPLQDHPDGISYEVSETSGRPSVAVRTGPIGARVLAGMRYAVAAMAGQGNNLIIDEVLCGGGLPDYRRLLAAFEFHVVGVFAPLDVLEARELHRCDRIAGLARWQYERVHRGIRYDFEVDTSRLSVLECAERIRDRFHL